MTRSTDPFPWRLFALALVTVLAAVFLAEACSVIGGL